MISRPDSIKLCRASCPNTAIPCQPTIERCRAQADTLLRTATFNAVVGCARYLRYSSLMHGTMLLSFVINYNNKILMT